MCRGEETRARRRGFCGYIIPNTPCHRYHSSSYSHHSTQHCWVASIPDTLPQSLTPTHSTAHRLSPVIQLASALSIPQHHHHHQSLYPHVAVQGSPLFWMASPPPPITRFPPD